MFVRSREEYGLATALLALGLEPAETAGGLGIPSATLTSWNRRTPRSRRLSRGELHGWRPPDRSAYSYLLGLYLGRRLSHQADAQVNRFRTKLPSDRVAEYAYARYFFSNLSEDIKDVFCEHCDLLGIAWSRANPRYVSVHDRSSVALLDSFVGPKR